MKKFIGVCLGLCLLGASIASADVTFNVEKRCTNGDGGLGPFSLTVTCENGSTYPFSLACGGASTFTYPSATAIDCSISETLSAPQEGAFDVTLGDTYSTNNGRVLDSNSDDVDGETFYVENTYIPSFNIDTVLEFPGGDLGAGPFDTQLACTYNPLDMNPLTFSGPGTQTFKHPANRNLFCDFRNRFTNTQDDLFDLTYEYISPTGVSTTGSAEATTTSIDDSMLTEGETHTLKIIATPKTPSSLDVVMQLANGDDGGLGPFAVNVDCGSDGSFDFSMNHGDVQTVPLPADSRVDCRVTQQLTAAQENFFIQEKGDTFGPSNGRTFGNSDDILASQGTLAAGVAYTQGTMEVFNTYVPTQVRTIQVAKVVKDGNDGGKGPFNIKVACSGGIEYDFEMDHGDIETFQVPSDSGIDCRISELLTPDQDGFFIVKKGDTFGPSNGRTLGNTDDIAVSEGTLAGGVAYTQGTLEIYNEYVPTTVKTIQVAKVLANGGAGSHLGPFNINITCRDGSEYDFEMNHGDIETFQVPSDTRMDCKIKETLTASQDGFFKVKKGDTRGPSNGRTLGNSDDIAGSNGTLAGGVAYTQGTLEIYNEYVPTQVVDIQVAKVVKDANDGGKGPFNINITCSNGDEYDFEMDHGDIETFQMEKDVRMDCKVKETLTATQDGFFKVKKGDTRGPSNGRTLGISTSIAGSDGTLAGGVAYTQGTLEIYNEYVPEETIALNIEKTCPAGDAGKGPFDVHVVCQNGDEYDFEMDCGEIDVIYYEKDARIDCRISETLTTDQQGFFVNRYGDTFGPDNGRMLASNSTSVDGKKFYVENIYQADGQAVAINNTIVGYPECGDGNVYGRIATTHPEIYVGTHRVSTHQWFPLTVGTQFPVYTNAGKGISLGQSAQGLLTTHINNASIEGRLETSNADIWSLDTRNIDGQDMLTFVQNILMSPAGTQGAAFAINAVETSKNFIAKYSGAQNRCNAPIDTRVISQEIIQKNSGGGSSSSASRVSSSITAAICGNGAKESGEACDDGNTMSGDGCSSVCALEVVEEVAPTELLDTGTPEEKEETVVPVVVDTPPAPTTKMSLRDVIKARNAAQTQAPLPTVDTQDAHDGYTDIVLPTSLAATGAGEYSMVYLLLLLVGSAGLFATVRYGKE